MAGTATASISLDGGDVRQENKVRRIDVTWTSDASDGTWTYTTPVVNGMPQFFFKPGSPTPTNGYAVTAKNDLGLDLLAGQASSLSSTTASALCSSIPLKDGTTTSPVPSLHSGTIVLAGSGCGNSKQGTVVILFR